MSICTLIITTYFLSFLSTKKPYKVQFCLLRANSFFPFLQGGIMKFHIRCDPVLFPTYVHICVCVSALMLQYMHTCICVLVCVLACL